MRTLGSLICVGIELGFHLPEKKEKREMLLSNHSSLSRREAALAQLSTQRIRVGSPCERDRDRERERERVLWFRFTV